MDIGVVLQTNPPAAQVIELARQAELYGCTHVWTFDSHLLWEEPFVIYSQILAATRKVMVGPMVTNPATRDWTVTASLFATLNEMFGNRTVCGIGRGDSAVRVTNGRPTTLATLREAIGVIRELANGRSAEYKGASLRFPWGTQSRLPIWVAGYGPRALRLAGEVGDGFILQLADPAVTAWTIATVREAAARVGRDPASITICVAAPAYVGPSSDLAHMRDQCRWFGGMVGNHVADLVARYDGESDGPVPVALTDYIKGRQDYDYNEHGRAGNVHTQFVPDSIIDRFCILGPVAHHLERLEELKALGVDQFAIYLQHDGKEETLRAYGDHIVPAVAAHVAAKS
jgi:probable F420-dependent oxidoreductase